MTYQVGDGNTNETIQIGRTAQAVQVGGSASTLVAFHGASPVDQGGFIATISHTFIEGSVSASAFVGFSLGQVSSLLTLVNRMQAIMVEKGLMAAS
jgi:hypothetical protein